MQFVQWKRTTQEKGFCHEKDSRQRASISFHLYITTCSAISGKAPRKEINQNALEAWLCRRDGYCIQGLVAGLTQAILSNQSSRFTSCAKWWLYTCSTAHLLVVYSVLAVFLLCIHASGESPSWAFLGGVPCPREWPRWPFVCPRSFPALVNKQSSDRLPLFKQKREEKRPLALSGLRYKETRAMRQNFPW